MSISQTRDADFIAQAHLVFEDIQLLLLPPLVCSSPLCIPFLDDLKLRPQLCNPSLQAGFRLLKLSDLCRNCKRIGTLLQHRLLNKQSSQPCFTVASNSGMSCSACSCLRTPNTTLCNRRHWNVVIGHAQHDTARRSTFSLTYLLSYSVR